MVDVFVWLRDLGLERYEPAFRENEVDARSLPHLTAEDLKEMGVGAIGHRRLLLQSIAEIQRKEADVPAEEPEATPNEAVGPSDRPASEAERRQLTVMFVDLVGSTALSAGLDPEEMREVIRAYQDACAGVITRFEGHVAKYMGDGVLAYFGWPRAHEDEAERAARAGLALSEAIAGLAAPDGQALAARVGIATGLVVVGDLVGEGAAQEQAVVGDTPNLAARLQGLAEPGAVVISGATRDLLGDLFELTDLGTPSLKGIAQPGPVFAVLRERSVESRFEARQAGRLAAMVGREQELALLMERWRQAKAGEGQMVLLKGEAGIGKSRITQAMIEAVQSEPHVRVRYQCSPYHADSALHPAIQQLSHAADLAPGDGPDGKLDKLERLIGRALAAPGEETALMAALLGLDGTARYGALNLTPQQQRNRTLQALITQLLGLAAARPVLFVVEDAHWIDPTTLELLDLCLDQIVAARVLLLITARPTFVHGFGGHPIVTRLALNRLGREQTTAIVDRLTGGRALPEALLGEIAAKTDGVPLFVEELTKTVLESGLLREVDGALVLTGPLDRLSIPSSLHDSLMARLDRLQPVKEVAQTAACIGRDFDYPLLAAVSPALSDAELRDALDRLVAAELVFFNDTATTEIYTFKHALVRDAAYESLLKAKRQQVHAQVVEALEGSEAEVTPEILAHHATEAGLTEKAIDYWERAGEGALARPAYQEAIGHLTSAIRLAGEMGGAPSWKERELKLQIQLGQALIAARGYGAEPTIRAFERALDLAEDLGDTPLRVPALFGDWAARYIVGQPFSELAARFARAAEAMPDTGHQLVALRVRALERFHSGRFAAARELVEEALALYDPEAHRHLHLEFAHDPRAAALNYRSWTLWHLGYPDQARRATEDALAWAYEFDHPNTIGLTECWGGLLPSALGRHVDLVRSRARRIIDFANEMPMPMWRAWARIYLGWSLVHDGQLEEGLGEIAAGLEETHETGAGRVLPFLLGLAAEAHAVADDPVGAKAAIEEAFEALEWGQDVAWAADLHRIRADLLLRSDPSRPERAEADLLRALEIARDQEAKSLELRAARDLARLWVGQDERQKAHDLLAPVYGWFTEGFDTPDLKSAKALLDELS
jgi:class 3 adenylate cyclase/predicted ATPase